CFPKQHTFQLQKELTVWEKIHIQKNKGKLMNFEIPANFHLIQRFIGPPTREEEEFLPIDVTSVAKK
ncbi:hypothetical protein L9F63_026380, partial [Diploptera punctata]